MIREYVHIANCIIPLRLTGIKPGFITMLQPIRERQRRFQRRSTKSLYQGKLCIDPLPPFFFLPNFVTQFSVFELIDCERFLSSNKKEKKKAKKERGRRVESVSREG